MGQIKQEAVQRMQGTAEELRGAELNRQRKFEFQIEGLRSAVSGLERRWEEEQERKSKTEAGLRQQMSR